MGARGLTALQSARSPKPTRRGRRPQSRKGDLAMEKLLTATEVAARLQVTVEWVHGMARDGGIPAIKLGRYWRFSQSDIDEWLRERAHAPRHRRT